MYWKIELAIPTRLVNFIPSFLKTQTCFGQYLEFHSINSCTWTCLSHILHTHESNFINHTDSDLYHCSIQWSYEINWILYNFKYDQCQIVIFKSTGIVVKFLLSCFQERRVNICIPMETTGHSGQLMIFAKPFMTLCPCYCKRRSPLNYQWFTSQWSNLHSTIGVTEVVNGPCYSATILFRGDKACWKKAETAP